MKILPSVTSVGSSLIAAVLGNILAGIIVTIAINFVDGSADSATNQRHTDLGTCPLCGSSPDYEIEGGRNG